MLNFRLNGAPITLDTDEVQAYDSSLALLREHLHLCGTKEGCASGDCGACTIAVRSSGENTYKSVNACIMPASQLNGLDVVTVEGLQGPQLHPVQQAMVEHHGSQCGFCTPGFVMSLFSLYHSEDIPFSTEEIDEEIATALGGNLCRCTGYRPIRDAALNMRKTSGHVHDWIEAPWDYMPPSKKEFEEVARHFYRPTTVDELSDLCHRLPGSKLVAGGTDLMLESTQRLIDFPSVIDVTQVHELQHIEQKSDGWEIGAAVTYTQLQSLLNKHYPAFGKMLHRLGSRQIRNRGTLAGNIANASPIGDTPPVLLTLDAKLRLTSKEGERTINLSDFFLDYKKTALRQGEFIRSVIVPKLMPQQQQFVWKISKRFDDDISAVLIAVRVEMEEETVRDIRIAFGGMAAIPKRAYTAEKALTGCILDRSSIHQAQQALAEEFTPLSDMRASADYRLTVAGNLLERLRLVLTNNSIEAELV
ncbi:Xanthine dehydrogenase [Halomonadaceae bacterium LMG 33818]|uniref:xanthine dehydrogenase small subunit n=1 Tax=Cernens ardua TaxID=3402176 RepID=UPI003EDC4A20